MLLPLAAFVAVGVLFFCLGLLLIRSGKNRDQEVFAGGRRRTSIFGPLTSALAGVLPCGPSAKEQLGKDLVRAGYYHRFALREFMAIRSALVVG